MEGSADQEDFPEAWGLGIFVVGFGLEFVTSARRARIFLSGFVPSPPRGEGTRMTWRRFVMAANVNSG
jgi:hypothetical protein